MLHDVRGQNDVPFSFGYLLDGVHLLGRDCMKGVRRHELPKAGNTLFIWIDPDYKVACRHKLVVKKSALLESIGRERPICAAQVQDALTRALLHNPFIPIENVMTVDFHFFTN